MTYALLVLSLVLALSRCVADTSGDWPMPRRDAALTGRSALKGKITAPRVADTLPAGAYEGLALVRDAQGKSSLTFAGGADVAPDYMAKHQKDWAADPRPEEHASLPVYTAPESSRLRYAKLLPDSPGAQRVEFEDAFSGEPEQKGRLYSFDQGTGKQVVAWETEPEKDMWSPNVLVTDTDADGLPEVVVATHYRVMIYNGQTGAKKTELRWHHMRNYGYFGCFTLPGERYPKFVVIADFISHIDILDYDGKKLSILWRKDIEPTIMRKQKITRPGPNPIADVNGDGKPEIILNLFNDTGDRLWHVIAYDAVSGKVSIDLPGAYMNGLADADDDGVPELFLQETRELAVPTYAPIRLVSLKGGKESILWSHDRARWQTTDVASMPLTENTFAALGRGTVLLSDSANGRELYAVAAPARNAGPTLMVVTRSASGKWATRSRVTGPAGSVMEARAARRGASGREILLWWRSGRDGVQRFQADGVAVEVVSWRRSAGPTPIPLVAHLRSGEPASLIFQNGHEEILAYRKDKAGWRMRWRVPGRGMRTTSSTEFIGLVSADVDGDGEQEVLVARPSPSGEAQLVALNPDGRVKWEHTFAGFDGAAPVWNIGGLTFWTVGHFTSKDHLDVFVSLRRSTMHSDEGYCLSGKDGRVLWRQDAVYPSPNRDIDYTRGYAGTMVAVAPLETDGLDSLVCEFPDCYWVASGRTGEVRRVVDTSCGTFPDMWVAYGTPVVADFRRQGRPQVLWGGSGYVTALLSRNGRPLWYGKYNDGASALQGVGDVEGSGRLLVGGVYRDGFRCYDPADGSVRWTYPLPEGAPGATITADVNGDGIEEFVFASGRTLMAPNGKDGRPNLVWSLPLPATPGTLAFADIDGDGLGEVIFGGDDGQVYIVGQPKNRG